jgi:hypothetical protein
MCPQCPTPKDTNCRNAKPQDEPYRLYDEQGLYLAVQPNGGRYWYLNALASIGRPLC